MIRLTMEEWMARPMPEDFGDDCIVVNEWGLWAVMQRKKVGPFRNEFHLHQAHPEFALRFCNKI